VGNVEYALTKALADNIIDERFGKQIEQWLTQFRAFVAREVLNPSGRKSQSGVKQLVNLSGLPEKKQAKFVEHYLESSSDRKQLLERLRKDQTFSAREVVSLERTLILNDLTLGHAPLIEVMS
jgi:hypothetical protein